eukprot:Hpha_TRINITY_DN11703_c0_g1::TRINITY_DN11703_c0_g1_i1::g.32024::m.32024
MLRSVVLLALMGLSTAQLPAVPADMEVLGYMRRRVLSWNKDLVRMNGFALFASGEKTCLEQDEYGDNDCRAITNSNYTLSGEVYFSLEVVRALEVSVNVKVDKWLYLPLSFSATCRVCDRDCVFTAPFHTIATTIKLPKCEKLIDQGGGPWHVDQKVLKTPPVNPFESGEIITGRVDVRLAENVGNYVANTPVGSIDFQVMPQPPKDGPRMMQVTAGADMGRTDGYSPEPDYLTTAELWIDDAGVCTGSDKHGSTHCTLEWGKEYKLRTNLRFVRELVNSTNIRDFMVRLSVSSTAEEAFRSLSGGQGGLVWE